MYRYHVADTLSRKIWHTLDLTDVSFGDPLQDAGTLSGTLVVGENISEASVIRDLLEQDRASIHVEDPKLGNILWSGQIIATTWNRKERELAIEARQFTAWLGERYMGTGTTAKKWTNVDRFSIVREVIATATNGVGTIKIKPDAKLSGKLTTHTIEPQAFISCLEVIETMAKLDDGFDWFIWSRFSSTDGYPELYLAQYYPERSLKAQFNLFSTPESENILIDSWAVSTASRRTRVYAIGEGSAPSQKTSTVTDAQVTSGARLLREKTSTWSSVKDTAVLTKYGNAELKALKDTVGTVDVKLITDLVPSPSLYYTGDRVALTIRDEFMDIDLPAVRIIDRNIQDEDRDTVPTVSLTLDLNDAEVPEAT